MKRIAMFKPYVNERAVELASKTLKSGWIGEGPRVEEFESALQDRWHFPYCVALNSGTAAIRLALDLAGVGPGDEVITVSFTCTATNMPILEQAYCRRPRVQGQFPITHYLYHFGRGTLRALGGYFTMQPIDPRRFRAQRERHAMKAESPNWLEVPTAGLSMDERHRLRDLAAEISRRFPDPTLVNLGVWKGASIWALRAGAPYARLVGVDLKGADLLVGAEFLGAEIICDNVETCADHVAGDVHLLFLDADPREGSTRIQIDAWSGKIPVGGIMAFLNYGRPAPRWGVKLAVDAWFSEQRHLWEDLGLLGSLKIFRRTDETHRNVQALCE